MNGHLLILQEMLKKYPDASVREQILLTWKNGCFMLKKVYEIVRAYKQKLKNNIQIF